MTQWYNFKEGGGEKVTQNKKRLGLAIPKKLYEYIKYKAEYQGKTINSMCLDIFWEYFESKEKSKREEQKKWL